MNHNDQRKAFEDWAIESGIAYQSEKHGVIFYDGYYKIRFESWSAGFKHTEKDDEPTLRQQYEDACITANANLKDAERWRFLASVENGEIFQSAVDAAIARAKPCRQ